jgi:preprotein translocase subunit SecD
MRRKQLTPLVFILVTAAAALGAVFATGTSPQLGLDLQGGISVVLQPTKSSSDEALSQTIEIIRSRVDALGVAEPEIARQGDAVVVQLPGVENQQRALELVGDTAELRFRPVLLSLPKVQADALGDATSTTTTTVGDGSTTTTAAGGTTTSTTAPVSGQSATGAATPLQDPTTTSTTAPTTTTTTAPDGTTTTTTPPTGEIPDFEVTPREDDVFEDPVTLEGDCGDGT